MSAAGSSQVQLSDPITVTVRAIATTYTYDALGLQPELLRMFLALRERQRL